jgi:hypothetical protein
MARDEGLGELIRGDLADVPGLRENPMFGGVGRLWDSRLLCAACDDGMVARLGKGQEGWAVKLLGIAPMINDGRPMTGWVRAMEDAHGDDTLRTRDPCALAYVPALPPK